MMENQFSFNEQTGINLKVLLLKLVKAWKWYVILLLLTFFIANYFNLRKENIYELDNYITVKEENNPFLSSNMSLVFNWGGVSDKVDLIITTLKSRSHNELVVNQLKSYITYQRKDKYYPVRLYNNTPFIFEMDKNHLQLIDVPIQIKIINNNEFELIINKDFEKANLYDYHNLSVQKSSLKKYSKKIHFGDSFKLPFLSGKILLNKNNSFNKDKIYSLLLENYNATVAKYKDGLNVKSKTKGSSILVLKLRGTNKHELEDYLNTTTILLKNKILEDKNKYAINTIKFIDSTLAYIQTDLSTAAKELKSFISNKTVLNLDDPTTKLYEKITALDLKKNTIIQKSAYYNRLLSYLNNKSNYEDIPAPTVVGIDDPTIITKVGKITQLAITRKKMLVSLQKNSSYIQNIDLEIEALRSSLLQTVNSALSNLNLDLKSINLRIGIIDKQINMLPQDKQRLLALRRSFELKEEVYNDLLQKKNQASIVKASNVSDLKIIDKAKDVGQLPVAPNRTINYLIALILGLLIPTIVVAIIFFLDNKVHDITDLEDITEVPFLGQVYKNDKKSKLPVFKHPRGIVAESFRSIRSAMRFVYPTKKGTQTTVITSSVSGEGKTFVSANYSLIQAASNKKTILLEFDLRKPKFKEYFEQAKNKNIGLSHYLSGNANIDDIIVPSSYENLDLVLSGSTPPNPSELILTDYTQKLFNDLSERYEQIIVDTPPLGLVSDALELQKFAGLTVFIVREDYSLKSFIKDIDERYKKGEINKIAIIYNDFKVNAMKKYGYSNQYGYSYGYGYGNYFDKKESFYKKLLKKFKK